MRQFSLAGPQPTVILIPGAGDALGFSGTLSFFGTARRRRNHHALTIVQRRSPIPPNWSVEQHAADYIQTIEQLHDDPVVLECASAGGPIGQVIAATRPDLVRGLILACSFHWVPESTRKRLRHWVMLAESAQWARLQWDVTAATIRPASLTRARRFRPLLRLLPPPGERHRFERLIEGILDVDTRPLLHQIRCPTLVIGGEDDQLFSTHIQKDMAGRIPGGRVVLFPGYGHGVPMEHAGYHDQIIQFIRSLR
ncbi:MAG: alpha/beta fold hydrolase [Chloroflexota bacterium]